VAPLPRPHARAADLPSGGFLLLPNHLTWIDAILLQVACPRPIRFIIDEAFYKHPVLQPVLRLFGTLPISPKHAKEAVRAAAESIAAGEIVCIFPEGELSRTGMLLRLRRGYELIARSAKCPVVPVWLDQLWGLDLFVRRREVFLQMAEENSVSGDRRFW
jgi:acyl-[acyl-carrier-protein]-phospholipid O-acyltransferase/long-chain-fatty-acid--[acyl-carrier-protein] ligase